MRSKATVISRIGFALKIGVAAALLASCGAPGAVPQSNAIAPTVTSHRILPASSYQVLHRFGSVSHGTHPFAGLIHVNGTLYGTTMRGGSSDNGTVYSISTTGQTKVLYSFKGGSDGAWPQAGLIDVNGTFYGTTSQGGGSGCHGSGHYGYGCGTVYSITTAGSAKVLHRFRGGSDGALPLAGLIDVNGTLYGTTSGGGHYNGGTIYSISTSGSEKVLYRFGRRANDGTNPEAGLIAVNGTLYGTTYAGGTIYCGQLGGGCGTVFSVSTTGVEKVLYNFAGYSARYADGAKPQTSLVDVKGTLYGTTSAGGSFTGCCGTVYRVTTTGSEKVLHFFNAYDGSVPNGLISVGNTFYGTTQTGGANPCHNGVNCGTIFSVSTTGVEKVLHNFAGYSDGALPFARLISLKGTLYGTTSRGGVLCDGGRCGTVFALTP
jgi:uncharacterized repeat protein (TIGR03803 family)